MCRSLEECNSKILFSSLVIFLSYLVVFFPVFCSLVEMNLDPLAFVVLLDLNWELLKEVEFFELADIGLEFLFTSIVKNASDDGFEDLRELVPEHTHNN